MHVPPQLTHCRSHALVFSSAFFPPCLCMAATYTPQPPDSETISVPGSSASFGSQPTLSQHYAPQGTCPPSRPPPRAPGHPQQQPHYEPQHQQPCGPGGPAPTNVAPPQSYQPLVCAVPLLSFSPLFPPRMPSPLAFIVTTRCTFPMHSWH